MVITWGGNSPEWNGDLHVSASGRVLGMLQIAVFERVDQTASAQHNLVSTARRDAEFSLAF